jgi:hypothetical protein
MQLDASLQQQQQVEALQVQLQQHAPIQLPPSIQLAPPDQRQRGNSSVTTLLELSHPLLELSHPLLICNGVSWLRGGMLRCGVACGML